VHAARLGFNSPALIFPCPMTEGLIESLPRLARDPAVGAIVLTRAGRAFCAGGDVKSMAEGRVERGIEEAVTHLRERMEVSRLLHEIIKPTIAMVNGPAASAGMALALARDLRIYGWVRSFEDGIQITSGSGTRRGETPGIRN
jgi:enoyl-CoA hydratase/carnithine racemase